MKMDRYAAFVLTFLCLQSLCFAKGASPPVKNSVSSTSLGHDRYQRLDGEAGTNDITSPKPTMVNCVAGLTNRSDQVFGIYANISAWGHEHTKSDAYSEALIDVSNDQGAEYSAIRAGLHTLPSLYNDTKLHLFVQWTTDRDWKTGCYNMECPGFVPFNNTHPEIPIPGMVVDALSSYNQTDSSIILQIVKDERPGIGGDWWLYSVIGPVRFPLGHWPASIFTSLSQHGTEAACTAPSATRGAAMGSGHGPREGYTRAAYFADISLMNNMALPVDQSLKNVAPMVNNAWWWM